MRLVIYLRRVFNPPGCEPISTPLEFLKNVRGKCNTAEQEQEQEQENIIGHLSLVIFHFSFAICRWISSNHWCLYNKWKMPNDK